MAGSVTTRFRWVVDDPGVYVDHDEDGGWERMTVLPGEYPVQPLGSDLLPARPGHQPSYLKVRLHVLVTDRYRPGGAVATGLCEGAALVMAGPWFLVGEGAALGTLPGRMIDSTLLVHA